MLALKSQQGDLVFFDVVSRYSRGFQSQATEHPVDGSGVISDHVINRNPSITINGYITGADFNSLKPQELVDSDKETLGLQSVVVEGSVATPVQIDYDNNPTNLFPDVIGQFFTDTRPQISNISPSRGSEKDIFKVLKSYRDTKAQLTLYEFDTINGRDQIVETIPEGISEALFITGLNIDETAEVGDALAFSMTLAVLRISSLVEEEIPDYVREQYREKAADKSNKGVQQGEEATITEILSDSNNATFFERLRQIRELLRGSQ